VFEGERAALLRDLGGRVVAGVFFGLGCRSPLLADCSSGMSVVMCEVGEVFLLVCYEILLAWVAELM
jgi:hypothetical protein